MSEIRKCVVCGREFEPFNYNQKCCCMYCSRENDLKRRREYNRSPRTHERQRAYRLAHPQGVCLICGKPVMKDGLKRHDSKKMHDECIFMDCLETLKSGNRLTSKQRTRLVLRGYSLKEFKQDYWEELNVRR